MTEVIDIRSVEAALEQGRPLYVARTPNLEVLARSALAGALDAHQILYTSEQIRVIADPDSGTTDKYVTLPSQSGGDLWVDERGLPDIGIRGINLDYQGDGNRTTVMHVQATEELPEFLTGIPVYKQLEALRMLGLYVTKTYVDPYLRAIADVFGQSADDYIGNFQPEGRIIRAILYHAITESNADKMPKGTDSGAPRLAIKEHNDKGSFTVDSYTTGGGLQYLNGGYWQSPPGLSVAIFPGVGDKHLPGESDIKPVTHRVVHDPNWSSLNPDRKARVPSIVRAAFPLFTDSTDRNAKLIIAGSSDTHPTYQ